MKNSNTTYCPLCTNKASDYYFQDKRHFYQCGTCHGVFLDKKLWLSQKHEIARYKMHNNNIEDKRYQQFVLPITSTVKKDFKHYHKGLDFGAGTGPVITKVLHDANFTIFPYDPYFYNHPHLLESTYNYVICCEVIEHFYNPNKEFHLLKQLLAKQGKLYCMTVLIDETIDFHHWYYKNDPTHVFLYHSKSIDWIKENIGFSDVEINDRLIIFTK